MAVIRIHWGGKKKKGKTNQNKTKTTHSWLQPPSMWLGYFENLLLCKVVLVIGVVGAQRQREGGRVGGRVSPKETNLSLLVYF